MTIQPIGETAVPTSAASGPLPDNVYQLFPVTDQAPAQQPQDISWQRISEVFQPDVGWVKTSLVHYGEDSRFVFRKVEPVHPIADLSVDATPPLGTRVNGYNTLMAYQLAQAGVRNRIVGTNQTHGYNLEYDAVATVEILNSDDERDPSASIGDSMSLGYSMGIMKGLGIASVAPGLQRTIKLVLGTDPCLAERFRQLELLDPRNLVYFGEEIRELGQIMVRNAISASPLKSIRRTRQMMGTVSISPAFLTNVYDKWQTLCTGEAGTFPSKIPPETAMVMHFFLKSRLNKNKVFAKRLDAHKNARLIYENGYHLSAADEVVMQATVDKAARGVILIDQGVPAGELVDALDYPILKAA